MHDHPGVSLVRSTREQRGISRDELAHRLGISVSTLVRLENAGQWPKTTTTVALCRELGLSLGEVLEA